MTSQQNAKTQISTRSRVGQALSACQFSALSVDAFLRNRANKLEFCPKSNKCNLNHQILIRHRDELGDPGKGHQEAKIASGNKINKENKKERKKKRKKERKKVYIV